MYKELIKRLRDLPHLMFVQLGEHEELVYQAADAIEELQKILDGVSADNDSLCEKLNEAHNEGYDVGYWAGRRDYAPKWIPVTERLPKEMDRSCGGWSAEIRPSDDVLVWLSSEKRQSVAWYSHTYNDWTTVDEKTVYCFGEVTHWRPLPEPPKEEN